MQFNAQVIFFRFSLLFFLFSIHFFPWFHCPCKWAIFPYSPFLFSRCFLMRTHTHAGTQPHTRASATTPKLAQTHTHMHASNVMPRCSCVLSECRPKRWRSIWFWISHRHSCQQIRFGASTARIKRRKKREIYVHEYITSEDEKYNKNQSDGKVQRVDFHVSMNCPWWRNAFSCTFTLRWSIFVLIALPSSTIDHVNNWFRSVFIRIRTKNHTSSDSESTKKCEIDFESDILANYNRERNQNISGLFVE